MHTYSLNQPCSGVARERDSDRWKRQRPRYLPFNFSSLLSPYISPLQGCSMPGLSKTEDMINTVASTKRVCLGSFVNFDSFRSREVFAVVPKIAPTLIQYVGPYYGNTSLSAYTLKQMLQKGIGWFGSVFSCVMCQLSQKLLFLPVSYSFRVQWSSPL